MKYSIRNEKIALSPYDDKHIVPDSTNTLPWDIIKYYCIQLYIILYTNRKNPVFILIYYFYKNSFKLYMYNIFKYAYVYSMYSM